MFSSSAISSLTLVTLLNDIQSKSLYHILQGKQLQVSFSNQCYVMPVVNDSKYVHAHMFPKFGCLW